MTAPTGKAGGIKNRMLADTGLQGRLHLLTVSIGTGRRDTRRGQGRAE